MVAASARAGQPEAISDLFAATGADAGSIVLSWSAPSDGGAPAARYSIRYRVDGVAITEANFPNSIPIEAPPLLQNAITPGTPPVPYPNPTETQTITGLTPGVAYYFAIKSMDNAQPAHVSTLSNTVFATAGQTCGPSPGDGSGTGFIASGTTYIIGSNVPIAISFTPDSTFPLTTGAKVQFQIPDGWIAPQADNMSAQGFVSASPLTLGGTTLSAPTVSGRFVTITVTNGVWTQSLGHVTLAYQGGTCQVGNSNKFRIYTQAGACGQLKEISDTSSLLNVSVQAGQPNFINFDNYNVPVRIGDKAPISFTMRDMCGNPAASANALNVTAAALVFNANGPAADNQAVVSATLAPWSPMSATTLTIPIGISGGVVYYSVASAANAPNDRLQLTCGALGGNPNGGNAIANIIPVSGGLTGLSVDTGALAPTQTHAAFSPDNDGNADNVFINFTFPIPLNWKITFSKDNFSTITRTLYGFGSSGRAIWDGYRDGNGTNGPPIAPPGVYVVKVQDQEAARSRTTRR